MATWPSKLTASGLVSDTQSKVDDIIDMFNITASPTDNYILKYDAATTKFELEADTGGGGGWDGTSNQVVSDGVSLLTPDSTAGITFNTSGSTFGSGVDYISIGNTEAAGNILPAGASQNFGDATHRFDAFFGDLNVNGTITGIDLADLGTKSINNLSDVDTTGVADGKILKYNSTTSRFEIADDSGSGTGIALTDLSVTTGSNSINGGLSYDNTTGVFTFQPVTNGFYNGGTLSAGTSITPDYNNGRIQKYTVYADNSTTHQLNTPTNMTDAGSSMKFIFEATGDSGQTADITFNITNLKTDFGSSGFDVTYGRAEIWELIYDGTNRYMYRLSPGEVY